MAVAKGQPPGRGDLIEVHWVDISDDATGNPEAAKLSYRTSYGLFWDQRIELDAGMEVLVTTTTLDPDGPEQQGYCIYPAACVRKITIVRRARRRKTATS